MTLQAAWRSPTGQDNAIALGQLYPGGFAAIAEFDRIGHLLLHRAGLAAEASGLEAVVGVALLRRAVALFTGLRTLFDASAIDPAKALVRAHFELYLTYRCLAYGDLAHLHLDSPTTAAEREPRAARYYVAAERRTLRSRALILQPGSPFPPNSESERPAMAAELDSEIQRLRTTFPNEWSYFGDVDAAGLVKRVGGREEPPWFAKEFEPRRVWSIRALAESYDYGWEYEFLYDAWSALVHARGIRQDVTVGDGEVLVHHPHDPQWFQSLAYWSLGWHGMLLMTAAKWHAPIMVPDLQRLHTRHRSDIDQLQPRDFPSLLA